MGRWIIRTSCCKNLTTRFALSTHALVLAKQEQTERILRAMDNHYFNILGHATGRLLLRRPGYELDMGRIIQHAKQSGCFF